MVAFDRVFADPGRKVSDFTFNAETAQVFDDMLDRSVPGYREIQRMICELAGDFAADGTAVYDLGCSTGTTIRNLDALPQQVRLVGVDASEAMLEKARENFAVSPLRHPFTLACRDLNEGAHVEEASVVVLSLTLQFVRPLYRERTLRDIRGGLRDDGCLILVEKILGEESLLNRLFIQHYHEFKQRNGYSEIEIAKKREALENVLTPYRLKENEEMLHGVGFRAVDVFFKWYNFAGLLACK
ncbi:MAG: carboxy-S-adenosyl-L-methionine synthase CmoA [Deltaproteobacteria bacterium]|nr:carboxy-S-adenosyl-L-methionine synthase CmoA [Deltaproteobacteria bacterium]